MFHWAFLLRSLLLISSLTTGVGAGHITGGIIGILGLGIHGGALGVLGDQGGITIGRGIHGGALMVRVGVRVGVRAGMVPVGTDLSAMSLSAGEERAIMAPELPEM